MVADIRRLQLSRGFGRDRADGHDRMTGVIYYAGRRARRQLEATDLVLFVPWLRELYSPLQRLADLLLEVSRQVVSGERVAEILGTQAGVRDADDAIVAPSFRGALEFDEVSFGYRPGVLALRGLSFNARPGQLVALVGSSGAGRAPS
jgi:ATP-binding cassette subfamily B protein